MTSRLIVFLKEEVHVMMNNKEKAYESSSCDDEQKEKAYERRIGSCRDSE